MNSQQEHRTTYRRHFIREKKAPPPFVIQDRDVQIVQAVFENRLLTISILASLFPPDETARARKGVTDAAAPSPYTNLHRRMARLFHHGYLYRFRLSVGGEHIYAIDTKGVQLLKERQLPLPLPHDTWRPNKERHTADGFVEHTLFVARFRASLQRALERHPSLELVTFEREGLDLKAVWRRSNKRIYVNPDAFFILKDAKLPTGKQRTAYFLEADRSSMQHSRLMKKYISYSAMYEDRVHTETFNIPTFRVLTVCQTGQRASNLLKLVTADKATLPTNHKLFFYFSTEQSYNDHATNLLADIWRRADDPTQIRSIVSSPLARIS